jgi:hypothetical protein
MEMTQIEINWLSVVVATIAALVLGAIWYSPKVFGKIWQREMKMSDEVYKSGNPIKIFGLTILCFFVSAIVFDMFIGPKADVMFGSMAGFMIGFAWIATALGMNSLFERKTLKLFLIDAVYFIIAYTDMGAILGAM